ncbi:hypothetical protein IAT38_004438 [Cryptococcus sp. DSM 104549]
MPHMLINKHSQEDLAPYSPPDLALAHSQWLTELGVRVSQLNAARDLSLAFDYGGMAGDAEDVAPLEISVEEARRMVSVLGGELRRREGSVPIWVEGSGNILARPNSRGM